MRKICILCLFIGTILSCNEQKKEVTKTQEKKEFVFDTTKLPKKQKVDTKSWAILKNWNEFNAVIVNMDQLYKVKYEEDLTSSLDALISTLKNIQKSTYPKEFDKPQIKSRLKVLETYILKTKATIAYKTPSFEPATELINAYNAYINQFAVVINNTLDTKLLLDDEE